MKRKTLVTLVTILLLVAVALPVGAQTIWQTYGNVRAKQLNVLGATDLDSTLNVDGAATLRGVTTVPSGGTLTIASGASTNLGGYVTSTVTSLTVTGDAAIAGTTTLKNNAIVTGTVTANTVTVTGTMTANVATVATTVTVGSFLVLTPATAIPMVSNGIITPTGTYQGLTATYAVGTASIALMPAGTLLRLVNVGADNNITITDTGTITLSGNIALGQYDSLLLMSNGGGWIQVGTSNN